MKLYFILLVVFVMTEISVSAQVDFRDLTLPEAFEVAEEEEKMVFVDCYTSWCGPCKYMADKIFVQEKMGEYLNERFVCVKFDMERGSGPEIAQKYGVGVYPTFLILNMSGELIYKIVGGTETADEFIMKVEEGFGENSAYQMRKRYQEGERDFEFVEDYIESLLKSGLDDEARRVSADMLSPLSEKEKCSLPYWFIYEDSRLSPCDSENMKFFLAHVKEFRANGDRKEVDEKLISVYGGKLEEMLRGRVPAGDEELNAIEREMRVCEIQSVELKNYIEMLRAINQKDTNKIYSLYRKVYWDMPETKLSYLYFRPILLFQGQHKWTDEQKEGFVRLTHELANRMESQVMQISLRNFAEAIPKY